MNSNTTPEWARNDGAETPDWPRIIGKAKEQLKYAENVQDAFGRLPSSDFRALLQKDAQLLYESSFTHLIVSAYQTLNLFLDWADCRAPNLAVKSREHLEGLLTCASTVDRFMAHVPNVVPNPPMPPPPTSEEATWAWFCLKSKLVGAQNFLRECEAETKRLKSAATPDEIMPEWKRGKLVLKQLPNGKTPAVFRFGRETFTVPSGNAWKTVRRMLLESAFDGHGILMKSPSGQFRREHRPFFSKLLTKNNSGWFIRTQ